MNIGLSSAHSTATIVRVLNLQTGYISPQYHFVCDDNFSTVTSSNIEMTTFDSLTWNKSIETGYENNIDQFDIEQNKNNNEYHKLPSLGNDWLTTEEKRLRK